jgi:hypothetical protein
VAIGRVVAAGDVTALEADPQMQPRVSLGEAVLAALDGLGELSDLDVVEMGALGHLKPLVGALSVHYTAYEGRPRRHRTSTR